MKIFKVGFIGAGLQARRRIPAIQNSKKSQVIAITSRNLETARQLAEKYSLKVVKNWQEIVADKALDIIVVATYPDSHAKITIAALKNGKHVLCEKPLAKTIEEAKKMVLAAKKYGKILKCGFNHRYHPAVMLAKEMVASGEIGNLLFGRGVYGHCGRPGFEKEWRANKKYAAGGILMEQGIHLIDLYRSFFGEFSEVSCMANTIYWPIKPLEDNAMVILKTKTNQTVSLHATNLQWKNMFIFEIYGTEGYIKIDGLGSSYGTEKLIVGKKDYFGPFKEEVSEFRSEDKSWHREWEEFIEAIENKKKPSGDGSDGYIAMNIVDKAYEASQKGTFIKI